MKSPALLTLRSFRMPVGIAARLRFAQITLFCGVLIAGAIAILQIQRLAESQTLLGEHVLPASLETQEIRSDLDAYVKTLAALASHDIHDHMSLKSKDVRAQSESLRNRLQSPEQQDPSPAFIKSLNTRVSMTEATSLKILEDHDSFERLEQDNQAKLDQLLEFSARSQILLSEINLQQLKDMRLAKVDIPSALDDTIASTQRVSAIRQALDTVTRGVLQNRDPANRTDSKNTHDHISKQLMSVQPTLSLLPTSPKQEELRQTIEDIKHLLIGQDGMLDQRLAQLKLNDAFEARRGFQVPLIEDVAAMTADLAEKSRANLTLASQDFGKEMQTLFWVQAGAITIGAITILLTSHFIIERQFNQRIQSLSIAAETISNGDLDHEIAVKGTDEIGKMAKALSLLKSTARELGQSNEELERFAYVAAHDLRSPLKAIQNLAAWTVEDERSQLSGESKAYLDLLQKRADRLNRLLNDLLTYAQVGKQRPPPQPVDLTRIVSEQAMLADPSRNFTITYQGLEDTFDARATALEQVIANLVSNAIKHHDRDAGRIDVRSSWEHGTLAVEIADDGPGIPTAYQQQVFGLFQTLKPRDDVEGSGLGLAIVRKLIEAEEGTITLISDPETARGTTFRITVPLPHEAFHNAEHGVLSAA